MPGGWAPGCVNRGPRSRRADLTTITRLVADRMSGKRPSHEPERGAARLAPMLRLNDPRGGGDVAQGHDPLAPAGGTPPLVALAQLGLGWGHGAAS